MSNRDMLDMTVASAVWGASFMFQRVAGPEFGPFALAFTRIAIAALLLGSWVAFSTGLAEIRTRWRSLLLLGVVNTALPFLLFAYGTQHVSSGMASVLNGTAVLFTAAVGALFYGERLRVQQVIGLFMGFIGLIVLVQGDLTADHLSGVVACTVAAVSYAFGVFIIRRKFVGVPSMTVAAGSQMFAALALLIPALMAWPSATPSPKAWGNAIAVGALSTALAYAAYFRLVQSVGAQRAIIVAYLIPLFGMTWGYVLLHEPVTLTMLAGCALIIAGVAISTSAPKAEQVGSPNLATTQRP